MQVQKWTLLICNIYRRHCIYIVFDFHVKVLFQFLEQFSFDFSSQSMFHVRGTVKTYAQYRIFDNARFINSFTNELTESFGLLGRLFSHWRENLGTRVWTLRNYKFYELAFDHELSSYTVMKVKLSISRSHTLCK